MKEDQAIRLSQQEMKIEWQGWSLVFERFREGIFADKMSM